MVANHHILLGKESHISRWYHSFPDLQNIVNDEILITSDAFSECQHQIRDIQSVIKSECLIIIIKDDVSSILIKQLIEHYNCVYIKDFILEELCCSELLPTKLRIDASTACQLRCTGCYMRQNNSGVVGVGFLSFENFKKLVDENPYINEIELSNSGEIFLNPDLVKIIKYAFEKNIRLTAMNGVNFNNVTDEQIDALVKYNFEIIGISLDGATQETYEKYRRNGNYERVIANIKKLLFVKDKYHSDLPKIVWQFILMEHNEHEAALVKRTAEDLGIPVWYKLNWDDNYHPVEVESLQAITGLKYLTREDYRINTGKTYLGSTVCKQMFLSPQINWDGRLLGCCEIFEEDYGVNVFDVGLKKALQSSLFIQSKRFLLGINADRDYNGPCAKCVKRKKMVEINETINPLEDYK